MSGWFKAIARKRVARVVVKPSRGMQDRSGQRHVCGAVSDEHHPPQPVAADPTAEHDEPVTSSAPATAARSKSPPRAAAVRRRRGLRPDDGSWRATAYDVIFEAETFSGRAFDIALLIAILASIAVVALETVPGYDDNPGLLAAEWLLTIVFTVEYALRIACVRRPMRYVLSFWGVVDLLSILPTYLSAFSGASASSFVFIRSIRLLRVFRVLKLWRMMDEADELAAAVWRSRNKIVVFLCVVLVAVTVSGTLMYHVETVGARWEGRESQFTSIPQSMYWATVTMTTVGYGDVVPKTSPGKAISVMLILLGYSLIIVPSTFVTSEILQGDRDEDDLSAEPCGHCGVAGHRLDANFCHRCGNRR